MMIPAEIQCLARRQLADYDARMPGTMFADRGSTLTIEDAYHLQIESARLRSVRGEAIAGYKIGCVSDMMQRQLGVTQPVFGHVFASEIRSGPIVLSTKHFDHLALEGEFAVTLAADIPDPEVLRENPRPYVCEVFPIIELHNYVFRGPEPFAAALIANNAIHAGIVVPARRATAEGHETLKIAVEINGEQRGVASLDPLTTLFPLARLLHTFDIHLREGDIVLTGSPLPLYRVDEGDRVKVCCLAVAELEVTVGA